MMSRISMSADPTAHVTETITASMVRQTTSKEEVDNNAQNFVLNCPLREIFKINIHENLRIAFTKEESKKNATPIHREIKSSFLDSPDRFIQRHSGFTIVCDELVNSEKKEFGLTQVTLHNASLINGAQTQDVLKEISQEYDGAYDDYNIRVEVIVERNVLERGDIAIARNTSNNVSELSRLGSKGFFNNLNKKMVDFGYPTNKEGWAIQKSETDNTIETAKLLQVIRTMTPKSVREAYPKIFENTIRSYSGKAVVVKEYAKMKMDEDEEKQKAKVHFEVLHYYNTVAPSAWKIYEEWVYNPDWIHFWKKLKDEKIQKRVGTISNDNKRFELAWAIVCPVLYGLQHFVKEKNDGWSISVPDYFDKNKYMEYVMARFKDKNYVPQDFAKDRATYLDLYIYVGEELTNN
jgi:hypothetical protein